MYSLAVNAQSKLNYYIDSYDKGSYELYVITIKDCETSFKISKEEHNKLSKDDNSINQMIELAVERYRNGCKSLVQ